MYNTSDFIFELPEALIAQHPCSPRDHSRLLVVERNTQRLWEMPFYELKDFLKPGDGIVVNDTKVNPARLFGTLSTGGRCELLLIEKKEERRWVAMVRPARKCQIGQTVHFAEDFHAEVVAISSSTQREFVFHFKDSMELALQRHGHTPLPPYIRKGKATPQDRENYQTCYATHSGSYAAPTAGLHFTPALWTSLKQKGIEQTKITLHVGAGTFLPVRAKDFRDHVIHRESYEITQEAADALNHRSPHHLQICVGTTVCRTLESAYTPKGFLAGSGDTQLFIYPGYHFRYVQALLTNFHLPGSSLLLLVSALGGCALIKEAYQKAIKEQFRFYSYGDAMLIL